MENNSLDYSTLILMGIPALGDFKYAYSLGTLFFIMTVIVLCFIIVFVTYMEETLHEPMYIFIANLMFNQMYAGMVFIPKLVTDILSGHYTISFTECLVHGFFFQGTPCIELLTFTTMACDRYLAVGHPLRYPMLMTTRTALKILLQIYVYVMVGVCVVVILVSRMTLCGVKIYSTYCETASLTHLACGDNAHKLSFESIWIFIMLVGCLLVIIYCYLRTLLVCLKISDEASKKAVHTLVTHILAFSNFAIAAFFVSFRYTVVGESQSLLAHFVTALFGKVTYAMNPIIYGIRTEALRTKIMQRFHRNINEIPSRGNKQK